MIYRGSFWFFRLGVVVGRCCLGEGRVLCVRVW